MRRSTLCDYLAALCGAICAGWVCGTCTVKNALSGSVCEGCTGPRDAASEEAYVEAEVTALRQRWDMTTRLPCRHHKRMC